MASSERRTPEQRMRDLEAISDLICQGWSLHKIAEYLEISVSTVSREAADIRSTWQELKIEHRNIYVQKELRRLDMLDRENWAAWEHSKKPEVTITEDVGEGPPRSRSRVEQQMEEAIGGDGCVYSIAN